MKLKDMSVFAGQLNQLDSREAMGLPFSFSSTQLDDISVNKELFSINIEELVYILESEDKEISERYLAGLLLALKGDPRINTYDPEMINIPKGLVTIGLKPEDVAKVCNKYKDTGIIEEWIIKETPEVHVNLDSYRIGKYLVTNQEYLEFIKENPQEEIPSSWLFGRYPMEFSNHPVYSISPETADNYCKWISRKTNRNFRLPTEYEWENAAAGPDRLEFPWGNEFISSFANTVECGLLRSSPVGMFAAGNSFYGVTDMAGNVEEFVRDYYHPYDGNLNNGVFDDLAKSNGNYRVARGGSFTRFKDLARCKRRHGKYPKDIYVMGFRLAEDI
ncbi:formylglycine-generating enzyme family protein [Cytobacillus firmus]|uniref:formylglycine-generating enzyme family protein n=1 Tax=Cytobacillus firmus TaxID=1399 RepID=UPI00203AE261|nr:SUMF1/EgtB/PvdO family nonheme iron enzyme [Cytobacillus firmus]MCM3707373.1 formylglycine-generating enzyme family protein [Cytobacillus firmus]